MSKNIDPSLKKIGDYLETGADTIFMIPEYQRSYSWEIGNCDKLWQDVLNHIESDSKGRFFFGTIIISCQNDDKIYSLIDGQQRTTTFLLLFKALLMRINTAIGTTCGDGDSESLCLGLQERRRKIMRILYKAETEVIKNKPDAASDRAICGSGVIMKNCSINELYKSELQNILSSVEFDEAESKVIKIPRRQKDNRYTNFFRNFKYFYEKASELSDSQLNVFAKMLIESCEVIEIKSWKLEQAITMFNSLNSDGLPLSDADIISSKLYAVSEKNGVNEEFKKQWKEFRDFVNELEQDDIVDIDNIFMQQMYYERAKNKDHEIISETGAVNVTTPGLRRYFTEINKELLNDPVGLCKQMMDLAKIWKKVSNYPIVQVLLKFNNNMKLFLACFFHRFNADDISENDIKEIAVCLLRLFAVLELVDIGYSSSVFKTFLFGESVKLIDAGVSVSEIKDDFDRHISEKWTLDDIKGYVNECEKNVLVYLNEYLFALENGVSFDLNEKYDIEHIMPTSGSDIDAIRTDAQIGSIEEFNNTANKLGNKILLERKINRGIGNEWFRTKVSTKLSSKTGYIDSRYPIALALVNKYKDNNKPFWVKSDIDSATGKASGRIAKFIFGT